MPTISMFYGIIIIELILDWAELHQKELQEDWKPSMNKQPLKKIDPLN